MSKKRITVCAHRGASGTHPENSLGAFDEAIRLGADGIEFDVRYTSDGHFVVIHDATVDRTTHGRGAVSELSLAAIRGLSAGGREAVPLLDEAMGYADRAVLNVHVKLENDEQADALVNVFRNDHREELVNGRAYIASKDQRLLRKLKEVVPGVRLCNLLGQGRPDYIDAVINSVPCEVLQPRNEIVTADLVDRAHSLGQQVIPFYADDESEMRRLIDCGVDGILTNFPGRLVNLLRKLS